MAAHAAAINATLSQRYTNNTINEFELKEIWRSEKIVKK